MSNGGKITRSATTEATIAVMVSWAKVRSGEITLDSSGTSPAAKVNPMITMAGPHDASVRSMAGRMPAPPEALLTKSRDEVDGIIVSQPQADTEGDRSCEP